MKYCIDCKWYAEVIPHVGGCKTRCLRNAKIAKDMVDGHEYFATEPLVPAHERNDMGHGDDHCGKRAKHYERRWWKVWAQK